MTTIDPGQGRPDPRGSSGTDNAGPVQAGAGEPNDPNRAADGARGTTPAPPTDPGHPADTANPTEAANPTGQPATDPGQPAAGQPTTAANPTVPQPTTAPNPTGQSATGSGQPAAGQPTATANPTNPPQPTTTAEPPAYSGPASAAPPTDPGPGPADSAAPAIGNPVRPTSGLISELATAVWAAAWGDRETFGPSVLALNTTAGKRLIAQLLSVGAVIGIDAAAWAELTVVEQVPSHLAVLLALAMSASLLWLPGRPLATWRCFTLALALCTIWHTQVDWWPWPVTSVIFYLLLCLWVAFVHPARTALGVWLLGSAAIVLPAWVGLGMSWPAMALICAVIGLVVAVGQALGRWRKAERLVVVQQAELQADQTERAVLAERTRIARELHDVVAHHMSMISIQAQAAPVRDPHLSEQSRQTFELIETTSRQSLIEMRRVIGLLREPQETSARNPQPSLASLAELVAEARAAGQQTELIQTGATRAIPDGVAISVYRIVQEALTNARRHAPGARTRVELHATDRELRVAVINGPPAASPGGAGDAVPMGDPNYAARPGSPTDPVPLGDPNYTAGPGHPITPAPQSPAPPTPQSPALMHPTPQSPAPAPPTPQSPTPQPEDPR